MPAIGPAVRSLLLTHDRTDVLEYDWPTGQVPRTIVVGSFDRATRRLDPASTLPRGVE